jgi:hypothetical protein
MKNFILALNMLKHFLLQSVLLVAEIVLTLFLITALINTYNWEMKDYNAFQVPELDNAMYFMGRMDDTDTIDQKAIQDELLAYLKEQPEFAGISDNPQIDTTLTQTDGTQTGMQFVAIDRMTCRIYGIDENALFDEEKIKQGILPAIAFCKGADFYDFYGLKKADSYPCKINEAYSYLGDNIKLKNKNVTLEIIDIKNEYNKMLPQSGYMTSMYLEYSLFSNFLTYGGTDIFVPKIEGLFDGSDEMPFWILLKPGITEQRKTEIMANVGKYGMYRTKESADVNTLEIVNNSFKQTAAIAIMLCVLAIITLFTISFLCALQLSKRFTIYYLCGASKKKAIGLYALFIYLTGIISVLIYFAVTNLFYYFPFDRTMQAQSFRFESLSPVGLISIIVAFALITLFSIIPFVLNYRKTSLQMYRL